MNYFLEKTSDVEIISLFKLYFYYVDVYWCAFKTVFRLSPHNAVSYSDN